MVFSLTLRCPMCQRYFSALTAHILKLSTWTPDRLGTWELIMKFLYNPSLYFLWFWKSEPKITRWSFWKGTQTWPGVLNFFECGNMILVSKSASVLRRQGHRFSDCDHLDKSRFDHGGISWKFESRENFLGLRPQSPSAENRKWHKR